MNDILQELTTALSSLSGLTDYIVYAAICIVTLIGVLKCLIPMWTTTHALRAAIRSLQKEAGRNSPKPVWQESRFVGRRLQGSWLRFLQNAEQLDRRGLPCNVEDYINDDTVVHGPGNSPLAELIPNLLTSLGILGTFMGLMRGLTGLDLSNADALISGVPVLLSGMRFAFGTSVAGISCSLVLNMLVHIAQGSGYRALDDFTESFTQLAMQRPLDNDVQMICQNQDRNNMLFNATDGLTVQMGATIERAVGTAMDPVARSLDRFMTASTRAQVEGVGRIVNAFVDQMNSSLNGQFLQLGQTLTALNRQQEDAFKATESSLATSEKIVQEAQRLHGISQDVITTFEGYMKTLGDARTRDERFEQSASDLFKNLQDVSLQQTAMMNRMKESISTMAQQTEDFRKTMTASLDQVRQGNTQTAESMKQSCQSIHDSSNELSRSYQNFVTDILEGFSRSLGLFDKSMNDLVGEMTRRIDALESSGNNTQVVAGLSEIQKLMTGIESQLSSAAGSAKGKEA